MFPRWVWRDDGLATTFGQPVAELAGIIGSVREQPLRRWDQRQQGGRADKVMSLARRQGEGDRTPDVVGYGMNLGRPSAA